MHRLNASRAPGAKLRRKRAPNCAQRRTTPLNARWVRQRGDGSAARSEQCDAAHKLGCARSAARLAPKRARRGQPHARKYVELTDLADQIRSRMRWNLQRLTEQARAVPQRSAGGQRTVRACANESLNRAPRRRASPQKLDARITLPASVLLAIEPWVRALSGLVPRVRGQVRAVATREAHQQHPSRR